MTPEKKKMWLFILIAIFTVGFACIGCVTEETRDGRGTIRSYHRSGPAAGQLIIDD